MGVDPRWEVVYKPNIIEDIPYNWGRMQYGYISTYTWNCSPKQGNNVKVGY